MEFPDRYIDVPTGHLWSKDPARAWAPDTVRVRYLSAGEGPAVILLHGLGASLAVWSENIGPLGAVGSVYAVDLPGHGKSDKPFGLLYDSMAGGHFLVSLMDALELSSAVLVGNSAGGLVASWCAVNHPERVRGLLLVDTAGLDRNMPWFLRLSTVPALGEFLHTPPMLSGRSMVKSIFHQARPEYVRFLDDLMDVRLKPEVKRAMLESIRSGITLRGLKRELVALDALSGLGKPVMFVWGGEDRILLASHAQRALEGRSVAPIHIIPDAGHWPMLEKPDEFNNLAASFIQGIEG